MGVFGLVNGEWKFFTNVAAAQAAGAVNISDKPEVRNKPGSGPPNPKMYWDEMTGQWRFPQPDGSTPGAMPTIGLPTGPGLEMAPFPPSGTPDMGWEPWIPPGTQPPPGDWPGPTEWAGPDATYPNWDDPPGPFANDVAITTVDIPTKPNIGPEWRPNKPFEDYVRKYPDLMEAYKKHKSKGGKGAA